MIAVAIPIGSSYGAHLTLFLSKMILPGVFLKEGELSNHFFFREVSDFRKQEGFFYLKRHPIQNLSTSF
jgi:hypothetical protein